MALLKEYFILLELGTNSEYNSNDIIPRGSFLKEIVLIINFGETYNNSAILNIELPVEHPGFQTIKMDLSKQGVQKQDLRFEQINFPVRDGYKPNVMIKNSPTKGKALLIISFLSV